MMTVYLKMVLVYSISFYQFLSTSIWNLTQDLRQNSQSLSWIISFSLGFLSASLSSASLGNCCNL